MQRVGQHPTQSSCLERQNPTSFSPAKKICFRNDQILLHLLLDREEKSEAPQTLG